MRFNLPIPLLFLLESLGLCLWQDVGHLIDHNGFMQIPEIREFLALIKNSQQVFPDYDTILKRHPIGVGTERYWYGQYTKARCKLIEFLEQNIKDGTAIEFSGVSG